MKIQFLASILFFFVTVLSCKAQEKEIFLEGKWKVVDWAYVSNVARSLDKEEKSFLAQGLNGLTLDFTIDNIFSTNRPEVFGMNNEKYNLIDSKYLVCQDYLTGYFVLKNGNVFFVKSNLIFKLEKEKNYKNSKNVLEKNKTSAIDNTEVSLSNSIITEGTYDIEELEIMPRLKSSPGMNLDEMYITDLLTDNILHNIDFSLLTYNDVCYIVDCVIDKEGDLNVIDVKEMYYYWNEDGKKVSRISEHNAGILTDMKKDIIVALVKENSIFLPGKKYNKNVNSKMRIPLRLISE